jgi:dUTP pyrophosphatase
VLVQRLDGDLPLPAHARVDDAGLDLYAREAVTLAPGARIAVGTGLAIALPAGYAGFVLPRSGLALRHGLSIINTPGLIDAGYRGEIRVVLVNHDRSTPVTLARGDRIAQLVVQRVERVELVEVETLPESARGSGGFGSSGR